jgi:hypothetical protein
MDEAMYIGDIELSACNQQTEPDRINRLERVVGYVAALSENSRRTSVLKQVKSLHDHKGQLTVTWRGNPTEAEKAFFLKAWESSIGDGADNVDHEIDY